MLKNKDFTMLGFTNETVFNEEDFEQTILRYSLIKRDTNLIFELLPFEDVWTISDGRKNVNKIYATAEIEHPHQLESLANLYSGNTDRIKE